MVWRSKIMKKVNKSNPLELYLGCWQRVVQPPGMAEQDHAGGGDKGVSHIAARRAVDDNAAETGYQNRKVERAALLGRRHPTSPLSAIITTIAKLVGLKLRLWFQ